ncbi:hypothetical protein TNCV_672801 [Trichonephila clavipes]|nr:hypothetical protein TNCV_672801 [Trichonephila clavipes]
MRILLSYSIGACVQRKSSTVMPIWKQWTNKYRTPRRTGSLQRKFTSVCEDRHLLCMAKKDRTTSSKQLAARWSTATGVSFVNSSKSAASWIG